MATALEYDMSDPDEVTIIGINLFVQFYVSLTLLHWDRPKLYGVLRLSGCDRGLPMRTVLVKDLEQS